jgi:8-oxo-dGTP diphosphatase
MIKLIEILNKIHIMHRQSIASQLSKYKDDASYFVTFTQIEKVGINPKTKYSTPVGVYTYQLKDIYDDLVDRNYIFGIDKPFINILKLNTDKILDIENYSNKNRDLQKLKDIYESSFHKSFNKFLTEFDENPHLMYPTNTDGKYIYGLMNSISLNLFNDVRKSMVYFNKLIRTLGYDMVFDITGTVHLLEPSQAIFLSPDSYKVVNRIMNKDYNKKIEPISSLHYYYSGINPTVDFVILRQENDVYKILLIKRNGTTERGKWALPGGFVESNSKKGEKWTAGRETIMQAAVRELKEETGLYVVQLNKLIKPIGIYEGNSRDPRDNKSGWSQSNAFGLILPNEYDVSNIEAKDDAGEVGWFDINKLPILAFDHNKIVNDALRKLL